MRHVCVIIVSFSICLFEGRRFEYKWSGKADMITNESKAHWEITYCSLDRFSPVRQIDRSIVHYNPFCRRVVKLHHLDLSLLEPVIHR